MQRWLSALLAILVSLPLAGYKEALASNEAVLRFRMTVTITTPEGDHVGSAVHEARCSNERSVLPEQGGRFCQITQGGAFVVDLGKRGKVIVLKNLERDALTAFKYLEKPHSPVAALPENEMPQMITFGKADDAKSVRNLLDARKCYGSNIRTDAEKRNCVARGDFAKIFGTGVLLKSVTIERTSDPVNPSIWREYIHLYMPEEPYIKWELSLPDGDPRQIDITNF